ncbi:tellurite resistance TerB family protein [Telmatospirillum sp. J64-1]|uniref:tellurite resistance TerB family protein n=1 Tax=Telmatospirillum sp. J64-1 TaxID=2502183 RepID=UPI0021067F22|nr:tellurite resistance TerB family protein [Telmatospirillum sp. J64-1]
MIDPKKLLENFMGSGMGSNLGGMLNQGNTQSRQTQNQGPNIPGLSGGLGQLATGAAGGGLIGLLLGSKKGRKSGGSLFSHGMSAMLGGLAYKAWQEWSAQRSPQQAAQQGGQQAMQVPQPPAGSAFDMNQAQPAADGRDARIAIVQAMIAAAKADGHIDATEQRELFDRIGQLQLDSEEKAFIMDELAKPLNVDEIAGLAANREQAAEIWLASRLAIDPDDPREQAYLQELATKMNLPQDLVAHLDAQAAASQSG